VPYDPGHGESMPRKAPRSLVLARLQDASWIESQARQHPVTAPLMEVVDLARPGAAATSLSSWQSHVLRQARIAQLAGALGLCSNDADLLLRSEKWDVHRAVSSFVSKPRATCKGAKLSRHAYERGLAVGDDSEMLNSSADAAGSLEDGARLDDDAASGDDDGDEEIMCEVCFESVPIGFSKSMSCGHRFCSLCWQEHLHYLASTGPSCLLQGSCLQHGCGQGIPESFWQAEARPADLRLFEHFLLVSFVNQQPMLAFCESEPLLPGSLATSDQGSSQGNNTGSSGSSSANDSSGGGNAAAEPASGAGTGDQPPSSKESTFLPDDE